MAGLVDSVAHAYRDPRGAMARQIEAGLSEPRALVHLLAACGLGFVASLPNALRAAQALTVPDAQAAALSAHLFGYVFVAPLLFYWVAAGTHLVALGFGGRGGFLGARAAVFWAALLGAPMALVLGTLGAAAEAFSPAMLPWLDYLAYAGLAIWLWLLASTLAEAEGFGATMPVAAVLGAVAVGVAVGVGSLASASPVSG